MRGVTGSTSFSNPSSMSSNPSDLLSSITGQQPQPQPQPQSDPFKGCGFDTGEKGAIG